MISPYLLLCRCSTSHITFIITSNKYDANGFRVCKRISFSTDQQPPHSFECFFCFIKSRYLPEKKFHWLKCHKCDGATIRQHTEINETHEQNWLVNIIYVVAFIILIQSINEPCVSSRIYRSRNSLTESHRQSKKIGFSVIYSFCVRVRFDLSV